MNMLCGSLQGRVPLWESCDLVDGSLLWSYTFVGVVD